MTLSVHDLTIARGGVAVLENVSFDLDAGEALVLRGPNAAGKTTLLRTIAGLQPPVRGRIVTDPETLVYAGHADGIKPTLSVAENLIFWARVFGRRSISHALAAYELRALADRPAGALSAGQKRRLGLARLLVTGRRVWLLDEPTVSLDMHAMALFAGVVREHLVAGGAALIATHIDLGLDEADVLDVTRFRAGHGALADFDGAFL